MDMYHSIAYKKWVWLNGPVCLCMCYLFAVDQSDQTLAAANVVADAAVRQPVDHGAVVHHVSAEEQLVFPVVEADAATGMTGHVEYCQLPVTQVNDIA